MESSTKIPTAAISGSYVFYHSSIAPEGDDVFATSPELDELPDPNTIKMFVGQIPKQMDECDLLKLFEKYGRVYHLNLLRDKTTNQSKGCCFVTFFTRKAALDAQNDLHDVVTLPGMTKTVQMKPADNENRYDRKLFIGMISKSTTEADLRELFASFGLIEDCTVLRQSNGESRCCGFITFETKQSAQSAIKAVHQSLTMPGCLAPIVVKFADTPKDRESKRQLHSIPSAGSSMSSLVSEEESCQVHDGCTSLHKPLHTEGFTVFVYHLLPQYTDSDLNTIFSSFGTVLRAKVFLDKENSLSKCFGFVTFQAQSSATLAVEQMNGFWIGLKRLKVQRMKGSHSNFTVQL